MPSHLVDEISADVARDRHGRRHHPVQYQRYRAELHPMQVPKFGEREESAGDEDAHEQP